MKSLLKNKIIILLVTVIAIAIFGTAFTSMYAMSHDIPQITCETDMHHGAGCSAPKESQSCINFHFSLLEKFSHGYSGSFGFKMLATLLAAGSLLFVAKSLFQKYLGYENNLRVRLRFLHNETISVYQDTFGAWLSMFEKRDPAFAVVMA